ncbi:MAG: hypothetical protein QXI86_07140 [Ignisphaera sp.]
MSSRKLFYVCIIIMLLFVTLDIASCISEEVFENTIKIRDKEIVWSYRSRSNKANGYSSSTLVVNPSSIEYQIETLLNLDIDQRAMLNLSYVFVGSERLFYQFIYTSSNLSISIDGNIVVNKDYIIVQWFSLKTCIQINSSNSSFRYIQINNYVKEAIEKLNLSMIESLNALMTVLRTKNEVCEYINIYDLYIDKIKYINYLNLNDSTNTCFSRIPMYTWIEVNEVVKDGKHNTRYRIESINGDDVVSTGNSLPCMVPVIGIVNDIIKNLEIRTLFVELSIMNKFDIIKKMKEMHREYIDKGIEIYTLMSRSVMDRYNITKSVIEIQYLSYPYETIVTTLSNIDTTALNKDYARTLLTEIITIYRNVYHNNTIDWVDILATAKIEQMYTVTLDNNHQKYTSTSVSPEQALVLVLVTLISVVVQVMVILFIILKIFKKTT